MRLCVQATTFLWNCFKNFSVVDAMLSIVNTVEFTDKLVDPTTSVQLKHLTVSFMKTFNSVAMQ